LPDVTGLLHLVVMRTKSSVAILACSLTALSAVTAAPPTAQQLLTKAEARAATEQKSIFITFDASW